MRAAADTDNAGAGAGAVTSDVVRIAVTNAVVTGAAGTAGSSQNHLMQLVKSASPESVVQELCRHWNLSNPEDYALGTLTPDTETHGPPASIEWVGGECYGG